MDLEVAHEAPRAEDPEPHAARRTVAAGEDELDVVDARTTVLDALLEHLRPRSSFEEQPDGAAARAAEGVPCELGDGRRNARLVLDVEAEQRGHLAGALVGESDVVLARDGDGGDHVRHARASGPRRTTTVASSVLRANSRNSVPAIVAGWWPSSPG